MKLATDIGGLALGYPALDAWLRQTLLCERGQGCPTRPVHDLGLAGARAASPSSSLPRHMG